MHTPTYRSNTMAIDLGKITGGISSEENARLAYFWGIWRKHTDRDINNRLRRFYEDLEPNEIEEGAYFMLNCASLYDSYSSGADRDRMKEVAEQMIKAIQDEVGEIRTTSRIINDLRKELQTSQDTIQGLRTRITELEGLIGTELQTECTEEEAPEEGAPTDEDTESGAGRCGLHSLSCTQCIDAFVLLLTESTGLDLMEDGEIPRGSTPRGRALAELYSLVSGKRLSSCKSYIRQRKKPEKETLRGEKKQVVLDTIKKLLQELKRM